MKTKFSIFTLAVIATVGMFIAGCGTDDLSTPTIVLEGDDPLIVTLGGSYTDPGFTASDDEDGDVSANVSVDDSDVDTDMIGEYEVSYTVTDKAGNTGTTIRTVRVVMDKAHYEGTYQVHEICDIDGDGIKGETDVAFEINDYTVDVNPGTGDGKLLFDNFGAYLVTVEVFFSGTLNDVLTVDDFNPAGSTVYFSADGIVTTGTVDAIRFDLDYTAQDGAEIVPCEATFEKL